MAVGLGSEHIEQLRSVDSPTVSNAVEAFKVRDDTQGFLGMEIRCLTPEFGVMVGYAVTAMADSTTPGRPRCLEGEMRLLEAIVAATKPAVLVIQDVGPKRTHSCFVGDVIATWSRRLGAVGVVTDGGIRDLAGILPLRFHVFAAGSVVSHGTFNIVEVGVPVEISGVRIQPGELIHGDVNGVTTIPLEIAGGVYEECRKVREREIGLREFAHDRAFSLDGLRAKLLGR